MDLSVNIKDIRLNIRTAVIIKTNNGYIFEKDHLNRFYWVVGGRIKINETSEEAAKREIKEELGIKIKNIKLIAIVEDFFEFDNENFHEICFYYSCKLNKTINLPKNYYYITKNKMKTVNIQPKILPKIINSKNNKIMHIINNK